MNIVYIVIASAVAWSTLGTIVYYVIEDIMEGDCDLAVFGAIFAPVSTIIVIGFLIGTVLILITHGLISRFIICLKTIDYNKVKGDDND